jgi:2-(3-amino-3-carboxypropyl)histidine synthase
MKILYIEARKKKQEDTDRDYVIDCTNLPKKVTLAYSVQYINIAKSVKAFLEKKGFNIIGFKQVLGCTKLSDEEKKHPILLISSGRFHAVNLAIQRNHSNQNKSAIYIYSNRIISKIDKEEIKKLKKDKELNLNKFFNSQNIGILVSTKPGQQNLKKAQELKNKIKRKYPEKKVNLLISNNININELENFQIDIWINTACPGLAYDSSKIINYDEILAVFD